MSDRASENLLDDHVQIVSVLDVLDEEIARILGGGEPDFGLFALTEDFILIYADGIHYQKEEEVLFPALIEQGVPAQMGPIGCLLMEHDATRHSGSEFVEALHAVRNGDDSRRPRMLQVLTEYSSVLRIHAAKEDAGLIPMSGQLLPPDVLDAVADGYEALEATARLTIAQVATEIVEHHAAGSAGAEPMAQGAGSGAASPGALEPIRDPFARVNDDGLKAALRGLGAFKG